MKWLWSKYKIGLLVILLPTVLVFVGFKIFSVLWGVSIYINDSFFGSDLLVKLGILFLLLSLPFLVGLLADLKFFRSLLGIIFSVIPGASWLSNAVFKGDYFEKIKSGDYPVVIFKVVADEKNPTLKLGVVVNTFELKEGEASGEYCLILEMTPPLPAGPTWIKKKSDLKFLGPDFELKDLLITTFSLGLNFPLKSHKE